MRIKFNTILQHRFGPVALLAFLLVSISTITRLAFLIYSFSNAGLSFVNIVGVFSFGVFYDIVNASYFIISLVLYLWLMPESIFHKKWHAYILTAFFSILTFILLFNAV